MSRADLTYGAAGEKKALPALRKLFGDDLAPDPYKYAHFDYQSSDGLTFVELKTRRNTRRAYPTSIVPVCKIRHAEAEIRKAKNLGAPVPRFVFAVQFTDGLFWVQHPFPHDVRYLKRPDRPRGADHAYFDVSLMSDVALAGAAAPAGSDSADDGASCEVYSDGPEGDDAWLSDLVDSFAALDAAA